MTVFFSKKCEFALQSILFLSTKEKNLNFSAADISHKLKIPKEFVSKILQQLTKFGIVGSKKGNAGGFFLAKEPGKIRLLDIVEAIDGLEMFQNCILGFPDCSSVNPCPVHNQWGKLRDEAYAMLTMQTLSEFKEATIKKIQNIL